MLGLGLGPTRLGLGLGLEPTRLGLGLGLEPTGLGLGLGLGLSGLDYITAFFPAVFFVFAFSSPAFSTLAMLIIRIFPSCISVTT